ncbi:hypothetical protein DB346_16345 [Verrucomicrobia bacterium LW23]|nr:hypothetical protein DB346_16345 [Verrucomicrobia bacterium LW23]
MSEWYYAQNSEQKGPVNEAEIKELLAAKAIAPDALVWKEGMGEWTPANKVPEFVMRTPPKPAASAAPAPVASAPAPSPSASPLSEREIASSFAGASSSGGAASGEPLFGFLYAPQQFTPDPQDVEKNKIIAVLALFPMLFWLPMVAAKDSPFAKYYGNQGLTLLLLCFAIGLVMTVFQLIIMFGSAVVAPLALLGCPLTILSCIINIGILAVMIMGMIKASSGKVEPLPVIGNYVVMK